MERCIIIITLVDMRWMTNSNDWQCCLSLEDVFVPKEWEMRQFGFIVALVQTNAFLLYNFSRSQNGLQEVPKAQFVRELCKEMIENDEYKEAKEKDENDNEKRSSKRLKRAEEHMLCKLLAGHGKWNGKEFRATSQPYQKYRCSSGCGSMIRTYCLCDKTLMLCNECYSIHRAEFN